MGVDMSKRGYLVLMCEKTIQTNAFPVCMETDNTWGVCMVYKTKKAAKKVWGNKVPLQKIMIGEKP